MSNLNVRLQGEREFRAAISRFPRYLKRRSLQLMTRLKREYQAQFIRKPWEVGGSGGGVPRDSNSLVDSLLYRKQPTNFEAWIPREKTKKYGWYVHEGTSKMKARPWFEYAHKRLESARRNLTSNFLKDIRNNLAK